MGSVGSPALGQPRQGRWARTAVRSVQDRVVSFFAVDTKHHLEQVARRRRPTLPPRVPALPLIPSIRCGIYTFGSE